MTTITNLTDSTIEQLLNGNEFTFPSHRKIGRIYKISAVIRQRPMCDLFLIKSADLKHAAGIYTIETIRPVIDAALAEKQQSNFRIR